jgi:hypothetical protein
MQFSLLNPLSPSLNVGGLHELPKMLMIVLITYLNVLESEVYHYITQCGKPVFNVHEEIVQARHTPHLRKESLISFNMTKKLTYIRSCSLNLHLK